MKFFYKPTYLKAFDKLNKNQQETVLKTDILIKKYLKTDKASFGLRVKHLGQQVYEARVNDQLRILWVKAQGDITFSLLGNHEEVHRFLKRN